MFTPWIYFPLLHVTFFVQLLLTYRSPRSTHATVLVQGIGNHHPGEVLNHVTVVPSLC